MSGFVLANSPILIYYARENIYLPNFMYTEANTNSFYEIEEPVIPITSQPLAEHYQHGFTWDGKADGESQPQPPVYLPLILKEDGTYAAIDGQGRDVLIAFYDEDEAAIVLTPLTIIKPDKINGTSVKGGQITFWEVPISWTTQDNEDGTSSNVGVAVVSECSVALNFNYSRQGVNYTMNWKAKEMGFVFVETQSSIQLVRAEDSLEDNCRGKVYISHVEYGAGMAAKADTGTFSNDQ